MLRILDLRDVADADYRSLMPRAELDVEKAVAVVAPICAAVAQEGQAALERFSQQFDHVTPTHMKVPTDILARCESELDPAVREAFAESIKRRREVCKVEAAHPAMIAEVAPGAVVEQRMVPVTRVGLYVPGGVAPLASSVIMNVVPAQEAGVSEIAVASPPQQDFGGIPHPNILGLCHMLGVTEVYAVGGAQAIAMFAHGVEDLCPRVDMVTGPGNIYVVAAKRHLRGIVGIDSEAGPTEIAILADQTADPRFVAADLISQAEHDLMAASVLVTPSPDLVAQVEEELERQVALLPNADPIRVALRSIQSAAVFVRDVDQGLDVVNAYAAEHLEIHTADAAAVAGRVRNAGAVFVGSWSPVSLGDYSAGSTHVLPTAGCAAHSSGLNVKSFLKAVHYIDYSQAALEDIAASVETFALAEQLPAHAAAITVRRNA